MPPRRSFSDFPMVLGKWQGEQHFLDRKILDELWADDYVSAEYRNPEAPNRINLLIPFYEYQGTQHTAHAPQACLLGGGWAQIRVSERDVSLSKGRAVTVRSTLWQMGGTKLLGDYFFFQRGRVIVSPWANKFYLIWDSITKQRTDGALVRMEMALTPNQDLQQAEKILDEFVSQMYTILPEYVPE